MARVVGRLISQYFPITICLTHVGLPCFLELVVSVNQVYGEVILMHACFWQCFLDVASRGLFMKDYAIISLESQG